MQEAYQVSQVKQERVCKVPGCGRKVRCRGLCNTHSVHRRQGKPLRRLKVWRAKRYADGSKDCSWCGVRKGRGEFYKSRASRDGLVARCKDCHNKSDANKRHGVGSDNWKREQLARQGGVCKICNTDDPGGKGVWHLDHDHDKKGAESWRAVLCTRCNIMGVAWIESIPEEMRAEALNNLKRYISG